MTGPDTVLPDMEEGSEGMVKYATMVLDFIKKDVFQDRKQVSVEEVVTLIAALTDISVTLLSKFRKDEVDPSKATEVGRDVFKYMVGRIGFGNVQDFKFVSPKLVWVLLSSRPSWAFCRNFCIMSHKRVERIVRMAREGCNPFET